MKLHNKYKVILLALIAATCTAVKSFAMCSDIGSPYWETIWDTPTGKTRMQYLNSYPGGFASCPPGKTPYRVEFQPQAEHDISKIKYQDRASDCPYETCSRTPVDTYSGKEWQDVGGIYTEDQCSGDGGIIS